MSVAGTILQQLGGNRFAAMTGAREFVGGKDSLRFRIGKNAMKIGIVVIRLNGRDLYDMAFCRTNGDPISEETDLYADNLERVFTSATGLYTRL